MTPASKNKFWVGLALAAVLCVASFSSPLTTKAEPTIIAVVVGAVGAVIGVDAISCAVNIIWGCDDDSGGGGGGGGGTPPPQQACTSSANACGQTNTGFISGGSCSATTPPNSSCPAPTIGVGAFYASPATVGTDQSTTLHWTATNATSCNVRGDNGFTASGGATGSVTTGVLGVSTIFDLTCTDGLGGPSTTASIRVIIDPRFREI